MLCLTHKIYDSPTNSRAPHINRYTGDMIIGPETGMTVDGDFIPPLDE